jgi:hypothetical protein
VAGLLDQAEDELARRVRVDVARVGERDDGYAGADVFRGTLVLFV